MKRSWVIFIQLNVVFFLIAAFLLYEGTKEYIIDVVATLYVLIPIKIRSTLALLPVS